MINYPLSNPWKPPEVLQKAFEASHTLAARITKTASKQTYYTIRFLVDRHRTADAYRAYAYFRWADDQIDENDLEPSKRLAFVSRQQTLIEYAYQGQELTGLTAEEWMLVHLIQGDVEKDSGLQTYIRQMMAVIAFDAGRRGRFISQAELESYTRWLATAVTEALHHFIGHGCPTPHDESRYSAVTAAHITHMLRDALEDAHTGYFNIPGEWLESHHITPHDANNPAYREWVESRVQLACACFRAGKSYIAQVPNLRCRLAGYAYMARFQGVLDMIEQDDYYLRPHYPKGKRLLAGLKMLLGVS